MFKWLASLFETQEARPRDVINGGTIGTKVEPATMKRKTELECFLEEFEEFKVRVNNMDEKDGSVLHMFHFNVKLSDVKAGVNETLEDTIVMRFTKCIFHINKSTGNINAFRSTHYFEQDVLDNLVTGGKEYPEISTSPEATLDWLRDFMEHSKQGKTHRDIYKEKVDGLRKRHHVMLIEYKGKEYFTKHSKSCIYDTTFGDVVYEENSETQELVNNIILNGNYLGWVEYSTFSGDIYKNRRVRDSGKIAFNKNFVDQVLAVHRQQIILLNKMGVELKDEDKLNTWEKFMGFCKKCGVEVPEGINQGSYGTEYLYETINNFYEEAK